MTRAAPLGIENVINHVNPALVSIQLDVCSNCVSLDLKVAAGQELPDPRADQLHFWGTAAQKYCEIAGSLIWAFLGRLTRLDSTRIKGALKFLRLTRNKAGYQ